MLILPLLVATAVPLIFFLVVHRLNLYAFGTFFTVAMSLMWGGLAFVLASLSNTAVLNTISYATLTIIFAPILEEILKSLLLIHYVRQPNFTYFVDGAVYGFAIGTAFAVFENLLYLMNGSGSLTLAASRAFSVSLMHGTSSALAGVALGRFRFGHGRTRLVALLGGWSVAIGFHMLFNYVVNFWQGNVMLATAVGLGMGGVLLTILFILWGLSAEKRWLQQTLNRQLGVSAGEAAVVQNMVQINRLLQPVAQHFGNEKRQQAETFLRQQAQLGLKQKAHDLTQDAALKKQLSRQMEALRSEIDTTRRQIGLYCMAYIRSIMPSEAISLWESLATTMDEKTKQPTMNIWQTLAQKTDTG